ncbi:MAG TPA: hypothetical protein VMT18_13400 [Planctomycetota bacterium]|nr:hypothetical protein [Planctomycetota bacterium]
MASRTNLAALLGLALGALACGGSESALSTAGGASGEQTGAPAANASLIALIANAPATVAHAGTRHFEANWPVDGLPQELDYVEQVLTDGQGHVHVDTLQVLQPQMGLTQETLFKMLQKVRQRTMYFVRDFGIRDQAQFETNYSLEDTGQSVVVAGVTCERLLITQRESPDRRYLVDVDLATGLTLRSREELLDGTFVTGVEYLTIDYAWDFAGVVWDEPLSGEQPLPPGADAVTILGFKPREPKVLPAGWQSIGLSKLFDSVDDDVWAKRTYSDGVQQIFFVTAKGKGPKKSLVNPPGGSAPPHPDRVRKMAVGPWTLLEADLAQGRALLLGRAPDGVLEDLLQSAFY